MMVSSIWLQGLLWGIFSSLLAILGVLLCLMTPRGRGMRNEKVAFNLDGRVVAITGAASGIGLGLVKTILEKNSGCQIHMIDVNGDELKKQVDELKPLATVANSSLFLYSCDICNLEKFVSTLEKIKSIAKEHGKHCSVLINNACVVRGKSWRDLSIEEFEASVRLGTVSQFTAIKCILPDMVEENDGMVVSISSLMGLLPGCNLVEYCTAKYGGMGLHESLALELDSQTPNNRVHFLAICPYVVDTGMFQGAFDSPTLWLTRMLFPFLKTQSVVNRILLAMRRREYVVVLPGILSLAPSLARILPVPLFNMCLRFAGASEGMSTFRGRTPQSKT